MPTVSGSYESARIVNRGVSWRPSEIAPISPPSRPT
ncbi:Uncharacterised protein [Bordetella pertussis]|nr:Uncharacterised protein [Bordetella pertussis]